MANQIVSHKDFFNSPAVKAKFQEVLKGKENEFVASLLSVVTNNNLLSKASNQSIMTAAMKAAVLNLPIEPSLGQAYIVPYGREAQFQLGYKGLIQLAQRSGLYKSINAGPVYKSQLISYNPLFEELELDFSQPQDEIIGYFAAFKLLNGFEKVTYWTKEKATAHGKRFSKSFNKGPWKTDFDAMAQKTALKDILSKYGPLSVEMQDALDADNIDSTISIPRDVTPTEPVETLDAILGGQTEDKLAPTEDVEEQGEPKRAHKDVIPVEKVVVAESETSTDTSYHESEMPNFDEETGEVAEEISLFEGNTTQIKEQK